MTATTTALRRTLNILADHSVVVGLLLRIFLAWFLPWLLDDGRFIPGVAYTDIDFHVFTDAADAIRNGGNPFDRHTYRYTPFLAQLLAFMPKEGARYLFCVADALCGWLILAHRRKQREKQQRSEDNTPWLKLQDGLWWLYNPLAINICTRGSSESLVVLLPVLLTLWTIQSEFSLRSAIAAGFCHGFAVHAKLYPIIYSLSFMVYLSPTPVPRSATNTNQMTLPSRMCNFVVNWAKALLTPLPLVFLLTFSVVFVMLTFLGVHWYGEISLQEGLLYHFSRVDHRHNYSIYWYWIYLTRSMPAANTALIGRLLLLPQIALLVISSLGMARRNLALAIFVQTYLFVIHNKVITGQYFTWFLCLLPLCCDSIAFTKRVQQSLAAVLLSIGCWLGSAYCLEMQGMAAHRWVWLASIGFFWANVFMLGSLLSSTTLNDQAESKTNDGSGRTSTSDSSKKIS